MVTTGHHETDFQGGTRPQKTGKSLSSGRLSVDWVQSPREMTLGKLGLGCSDKMPRALKHQTSRAPLGAGS